MSSRRAARVFETAKVEGRTGFTVHTDRGDLSAPLIVDGLGWRRILGAGDNVQPPNARLSRGLEIHPHAPGEDLELWIDPKYVRRGYSWSFPADGELRVGVGSFDPRDHVKAPTLQLAEDVGVPAERWQGNWIPHQLRPAVEDGIFFVGDSAGHCLPTTAEGIRPAFYFGIALGRELVDVVEGRQTREQALTRYGAFSARPPLAVPLAAARAELGRADHADAAAQPGDPRDQPARARALGVRQLPRHLPAGVRRASTSRRRSRREPAVVAAA